MSAKVKELDQYFQMLINPETFGYSRKQFAETLQVNGETITIWNREKVDWEWVRDERRKGYSQVTPKIDDALIKEAQDGDIKAIALYYERYDGYVPTSSQKTIHEISEDDVNADQDDRRHRWPPRSSPDHRSWE